MIDTWPLSHFPKPYNGMSVQSGRLPPRGPKPKVRFKRTTYRKAYPFLVEEFGNRCVYSGQHRDLAGGDKAMEVDHFNPDTKNDIVQDYHNLVLATRHCNGCKSSLPSKTHKEQGLRFLNPCTEKDYGLHIFEDPASHYLWGETHLGRFHILKLGLNARHLVNERKRRYEIWAALREEQALILKPNVAFEMPAPLRLLIDEVKLMIPEWALKAPPPETLML